MEAGSWKYRGGLVLIGCVVLIWVASAEVTQEILAAEHKLEALEGAVGLHKLHSVGDGDWTESTGATAVPQADVSSPGRDALSSGGALALAILCNKALFPIRAPFTLAVTPTVSRYLNRLRRIT
eukprot:SM000058S18503  [mRNA]  locus=s58:193553:194301:+ [translate_table: standard]